MMARKEKKGDSLRSAALLSSVGLILVCAIFIGYFFGSWLDKKFGTEPYLMLVFTLLGVAGGFVEMFQVVAKSNKN